MAQWIKNLAQVTAEMWVRSLCPARWVKGSSVATAAAQIQSLTQEPPSAPRAAIRKKRKKGKGIHLLHSKTATGEKGPAHSSHFLKVCPSSLQGSPLFFGGGYCTVIKTDW